MKYHDFDERLGWSRGKVEHNDLLTLQRMIPKFETIEKAPRHLDRQGVDYIITLKGGAIWNVDAKSRDRGASRYWKEGAELALEKWSVMPDGENIGKVGWTLDTAKKTDLVLFTFDPIDCGDVYLLSFPLLQMAFRKNIHAWYEQYDAKKQWSGTWQSEAVYVPVEQVLYAIDVIQRSRHPEASPVMRQGRMDMAAPILTPDRVQELWMETASALGREKAYRLVAYMQSCCLVTIEGTIITAHTMVPLVRDMLELPKNKAEVETALTKVFGLPCTLRMENPIGNARAMA